jgi:Ca2+-transporting ATPase
MAHVLAIRSERDSLFRQGLFSNPGLLGAVSLTIGLQIAILYVPALQSVFRTEPLSFAEFAGVVGAAAVVFVVVELEKLIRRTVTP